MHSSTIAILAALPWLVTPLVVFARLRDSRSLDDESSTPPVHAPRVSIVIPARNEAHNIGDCARSVLASDYPALEVIIVDDQSTDDTASIARGIAEHDRRVQLLSTPPLPDEWFGKQWACSTGAAHATGDILIFVDADTRLAPDLVTRSVNGMLRTGADLYTVAGRQEMRTLWERMIQPQVFLTLAARYGSTEQVNRSRHAWDKIANGQYLMLRASTYHALGGHALVRRYVAEDLMLAQKYFEHGRRTVLVLGADQLSTRMYTSLGELIRGWGKNIYAGGIHAVPMGAVGRAFFPVVLPMSPLFQLVPVVLLLLALAGIVGHPLLLWSATTCALLVLQWAVVYRGMGLRAVNALAFPLGATLLLYIILRAISRGTSVAWKGREYTAHLPAEVAPGGSNMTTPVQPG